MKQTKTNTKILKPCRTLPRKIRFKINQTAGNVVLQENASKPNQIQCKVEASGLKKCAKNWLQAKCICFGTSTCLSKFLAQFVRPVDGRRAFRTEDVISFCRQSGNDSQVPTRTSRDRYQPVAPQQWSNTGIQIQPTHKRNSVLDFNFPSLKPLKTLTVKTQHLTHSGDPWLPW